VTMKDPRELTTQTVIVLFAADNVFDSGVSGFCVSLVARSGAEVPGVLPAVPGDVDDAITMDRFRVPVPDYNRRLIHAAYYSTSGVGQRDLPQTARRVKMGRQRVSHPDLPKDFSSGRICQIRSSRTFAEVRAPAFCQKRENAFHPMKSMVILILLVETHTANFTAKPPCTDVGYGQADLNQAYTTK